MRRALGLFAACAAAAVLFVSASAQGGEEGAYEVRAIFDNASFAVEGIEVRIAGAKVGSVTDVDVTGTEEAARADGGPEPGKAVLVLRIDDPGFQQFRADASCLIRPQSLIGERFVECEPTNPRAASSELPPLLEQIPDGEPGEGQHLLPLEQNGKAVDLDLVNNIMDEPYPDRFRLILNEFGAGLAARGEELAEIVERANPALRETNEVLAILDRQNRRLAQLATDSDAVLSALARERDSVKGFINESTVAAEATAARSADLEATFAKFPGFLRETEATMIELERFSDAAAPVFGEFRAAAPSLTRATRALEPFSGAAEGALVTLGDAAEEAGPDLVDADPVIRQIRGLSRSAAPATGNLRTFLTTLRKSNGFEYLAELIFNASGSVNSFDSYGHFLRALLPINNCVDYEVVIEPGCDQSFGIAAPTELSAAFERRMLRELAPDGARNDGAPEGPAPSAGQEPRTGGKSARGAEDDTPGLGLPIPEEGIETPPAAELDPGQAESPAPAERTRMGAARALLDFVIGRPSKRGRR